MSNFGKYRGMQGYWKLVPKITWVCPKDKTEFESFFIKCSRCEYFVEKKEDVIWCKFPKCIQEVENDYSPQ